jgi:fructan beta-fructosidase
MRLNILVFLSCLAVSVLLCAPAHGSDLLFENSDFEEGDLTNWTADGDAMTAQPTKGDNSMIRKKEPAGIQGKFWIGTFEKYDGKTGKPGRARGDKPVGTLTSKPFTLKKRYITFLVGGGANAAKVGVRILHKGKSTRIGAGFNTEQMVRVSFDAKAFVGKEIQILISDQADRHWGHINADDFRADDKPAPKRTVKRPKVSVKKPKVRPILDHRTFASYKGVGYKQKYRPQFHFTSIKNWLNDPNGMVYYDGEWHLYFQHHALGLGPGPKSWGHAISKDLVHWRQLPHAILPYGNGAIWSGTAVVDNNNSLGKQTGETKTIVAYFTKTQPRPDDFIQSGAYSTDRGRTFTLINKGLALVPNQGFSHGERDPKVFFDARNKKWIMVLILGGKERVIRFFGSDNMVAWKKIGDINRKWAAECIDLFPLTFEGKTKWVIADASYDYEIGQFDGKVFKSSGKTHQGDWGPRCFYAAQVFNNGPDGRVVQIGWMKDKRPDNVFLANKMPFNQQMSFPCDLSLRKTPAGVRMFRWPVKEIESLYARSESFKDLNIASANKALAKIKPELIDMSVEFAPGDNELVEFNVRGLKVVYGRIKKYRTKDGMQQAKSIAVGDCMVPASVIDGKVKLRMLVDRTSIELFVNEGLAVGTTYAVPDAGNRSLSISAVKDIKIHSLVVNELKSSWD